MIIGIADPYSAPTAEQRKLNLDAMNQVAARVLEMGYVPLIGINAALPVLEKANVPDVYKGLMDISLAVISVCDALIMIGDSPGANREKDLILSKGKPVFRTIDELNAFTGVTY